MRACECRPYVLIQTDGHIRVHIEILCVLKSRKSKCEISESEDYLIACTYRGYNVFGWTITVKKTDEERGEKSSSFHGFQPYTKFMSSKQIKLVLLEKEKTSTKKKNSKEKREQKQIHGKIEWRVPIKKPTKFRAVFKRNSYGAKKKRSSRKKFHLKRLKPIFHEIRIWWFR